MGNPPYAEWQKGNSAVRLVPFAEAGGHGELIVNATPGTGALSALEGAGATNLSGKVLVDVANPLDFSQGFPPKETVRQLLREFGWPEEAIVDLGGIRAARGTEMYLPFWLSLMGLLGTGDFNIDVVKA